MQQMVTDIKASDCATVKISTSVWQELDKFRQVLPEQTEAGGMLLGRLIDEAEDVVIDDVTIPGTQDRRQRFSFFRDKKPAQDYVDKVWQKSDHTINYLGEWHSHPEDDPTPSSQDISNWQQIVKRSRFEQDFLVFLIVGRTMIRGWLLFKTMRLPKEIPIFTEPEHTF